MGCRILKWFLPILCLTGRLRGAVRQGGLGSRKKGQYASARTNTISLPLSPEISSSISRNSVPSSTRTFR